MIKQVISELLAGRHLDYLTTKNVMREIIEGKATPAQTGALLAALRLKGETIEEITACVCAMREKSTKLNPLTDVIDIVGTGGDGAFTFNNINCNCYSCCCRRSVGSKARRQKRVK